MKFFALFDDVFALRKQKGLAWFFTAVKVLGGFSRKKTLVLLHNVIQIFHVSNAFKIRFEVVLNKFTIRFERVFNAFKTRFERVLKALPGDLNAF